MAIKIYVVLITMVLLATPILGADISIGYKDPSNSGVFIDTGGGNTFIDLSDTPSTYAGSSVNCVKVNAGETGLIFGSCAVGGGSKAGDLDYLYNNTGTMFFNAKRIREKEAWVIQNLKQGN